MIKLESNLEKPQMASRHHLFSRLYATKNGNYASFAGCAFHFAGRFVTVARRVRLRPTTRFAGCVPSVSLRLKRWLLGYCSAAYRPYPCRSDQAGSLPVIFRSVTLLNVAPKAGCRASFASSLSRRAGQSPPRNNQALGCLKSAWADFCYVAPPVPYVNLGLAEM